MIVPVETITHVICNPGVMARRIRVTAEDVHDPLFDSVHASRRRTDQASTELVRFRQIASSLYAEFAIGKGTSGCKDLTRDRRSASAVYPPSQRCCSGEAGCYGETAFAL